MSDSGIKYSSDLGAPPTGTSFQPAGTLGDKDVAFSSDTGATGGKLDEAKAAVRDNAGKLTGQATDKAREYAEQGKAKATEALGNLSRMLEDAATQVDGKLGAQYGQYARNAAGTVTGFADSLDAKDVDQLVDDVRGFVRASPAVAIGAAAAVGFVVARLFQAGLDGRDD